MRDPKHPETLLPLEVKKDVENYVDSLKALITATVNIDLNGLEIDINMQPVTILVVVSSIDALHTLVLK